MLTYLSSEQMTSERPWAPTSVCASEPTLVSAVPSAAVFAHVAPAVAGVGVEGVSGVEGVLVAQRQLGMKPSRTHKTRGTTGFTTAVEGNWTASKRIDAVSGVPPRGRPV